jgi:hypothetical protein
MADGIIPSLLERIFGKNWQTSFWGGLMLIAMAINQAPTIIEFLPDNTEAWVRGVSGILALAFGGKFVAVSKSKDVTGVPGINAQNKEELKRELT